MKAFLTFIVTMFFGAQLFAHIGDNEQKIEELCGKPITSGFPDKRGVTTNKYQAGNYIVLVQFFRHLSIAESYTRADQRDFSEEELNGFLEGRSYSSQAWIKDPNKREWVRLDRHARAWCTTVSGRPTFLIEVQ
ncbi:MAG TPA: hypothetical protein VJ281_02305 [Chthoniobacterales bacterium]|jgi:hypothetical protein|nr:hypothetical protein [Chthoniobacterales bacterium]